MNDSLQAKVSLAARTRLLSLGFHGLTNTPKEIFRLDRLLRLDLSNNRLVELPGAVCQLENLEQLWLNCNALKSLPVELGKCRKLKFLDASSNDISQLPSELGILPRLLEFDISRNPLESSLFETYRMCGARGVLEVLRKVFDRDFARALQMVLNPPLTEQVQEIYFALKEKGVAEFLERLFAGSIEVTDTIPAAPAHEVLRDAYASYGSRGVLHQLKHVHDRRDMSAALHRRVSQLMLHRTSTPHQRQFNAALVDGILDVFPSPPDVWRVVRNAQSLFPVGDTSLARTTPKSIKQRYDSTFLGRARLEALQSRCRSVGAGRSAGKHQQRLSASHSASLPSLQPAAPPQACASPDAITATAVLPHTALPSAAALSVCPDEPVAPCQPQHDAQDAAHDVENEAGSEKAGGGRRTEAAEAAAGEGKKAKEAVLGSAGKAKATKTKHKPDKAATNR